MVHEITPLTDKPPGVVRMPEASRDIQEDMKSPEQINGVMEQSTSEISGSSNEIDSVLRVKTKLVINMNSEVPLINLVCFSLIIVIIIWHNRMIH